MSMARGTLFPTIWTSKEKFTNSAFPLILAETIPINDPASSPVLILKFESFTHTGLPSQVVFCAPWAVSADFAMFGYGIGTNGAGGAGVLQTSGNAIDTPLLPACTTLMLLTPTVTGMVGLSYLGTGSPYISTAATSWGPFRRGRFPRHSRITRRSSGSTMTVSRLRAISASLPSTRETLTAGG